MDEELNAFDCGADPMKWATYLDTKMKLGTDVPALAGMLSNVIEISHQTKLSPITADTREVG